MESADDSIVLEPRPSASTSERKGDVSSSPTSADVDTHVVSIKRAVKENDFPALCELASRPGGYVHDSIRQQVWPILLNCSQSSAPSDEWKILKAHRDEHQVDLDVNRAFVYYPQQENEAQLVARRKALTELIVSTLRCHDGLSYFQGFHDIAQVMLLVLGLPKAQTALPRLSLLRVRDFMLPTISGTRSHLELIPAILMAEDPPLCRHLTGLQSFFALSATLTMFAHDIEEYGGIARLFDYLLARPAVVSVYMFAAIVSLRRSELLEIGADEPEMLYAVLSKLPKPLDLEALIQRTEELRARHPPHKLPLRRWSSVSQWSVLKTTEPLKKLETQTLVDGETWLKNQATEIEAQEKRKQQIARFKKLVIKHGTSRPALMIALAVLAGATSFWLGKGNQGALRSQMFLTGRATILQLDRFKSWLRGVI